MKFVRKINHQFHKTKGDVNLRLILFGIVSIIAGVLLIQQGQHDSNYLSYSKILGLGLFCTGIFSFVFSLSGTSWHLIAFLTFFLCSGIFVWVQSYTIEIKNVEQEIKILRDEIKDIQNDISKGKPKAHKGSKPDVNPTIPKNPPETSLLKIAASGEFIISFFALLIAAVALIFGKKIEELFQIRDQLKEVSRLTVSNAELALTHLPDFTESHQVPKDSYETMKIIDDIIFHPGSHVLRYLDEVGNGDTLRFTRAISLFAEGNYDDSIRTLEEVIYRGTKIDVRYNAYYTLGIAHREQGDFVDSIESFCKLCKTNHQMQHIKGKYGIALTLFAIMKSFETHVKWQLNKKDALRFRDCLRHIGQYNYNGDEAQQDELKQISTALIENILKDDPFNYSAILYDVLIRAHPALLPKLETITESQIKGLELLHRFLLQEIPESFNIRANYFVVEGITKYCLKKDSDEIFQSLNFAEDTAKLLQRINSDEPKPFLIFSDISIKHLPLGKFLEEIESIKVQIRSAQ
jgi:tetratricopeptide (TPR) repeat protein